MMDFLKKIPVKFVIAAILVLVFCVCWLVDYCIAQTYEINYTYESVYGDLTADQRNTVTIVVTLTQNGKPVAGHSLWMNPPLAYQDGEWISGGQMQKNLVVTDENGQAVFTYYPYTANKLKPANFVKFVVKDQSNSLIVEVNAEKVFWLELV